jgi:hypothetical protein
VYEIFVVPFIVSPSTAALSPRGPVSAGTSHDKLPCSVTHDSVWYSCFHTCNIKSQGTLSCIWFEVPTEKWFQITLFWAWHRVFVSPPPPPPSSETLVFTCKTVRVRRQKTINSSSLVKTQHSDPHNIVRSAVKLYNMTKVFLPESQSSPHETLVQIAIVEFAIELGSDLLWAKPAVLCLWFVTDVFQVKINWAKVQSCFVRVKQYTVAESLLEQLCTPTPLHL